MYTVESKNDNIYIYGLNEFDLPHTLDCGQAFRWECIENEHWRGVAFNRYLELEKTADNTIILYNSTITDFNCIWKNYFDLERDYDAIISAISQNEVLKKAAQYAYGIRILNQEPWETLCSFIISQNNNIKRIKGIISRLCESFGVKHDGWYSFPSAETISKLTVDDLAVLRSGFRAKYILDAAKKIVNGEVNLSALYSMPTEDARNELMKINGVGPKVADCVLLFSLKHVEAFPKDVWIKRAMETLFKGNLPEVALPYAGIVQQYIFFYARDRKLK